MKALRRIGASLTLSLALTGCGQAADEDALRATVRELDSSLRATAEELREEQARTAELERQLDAALAELETLTSPTSTSTSTTVPVTTPSSPPTTTIGGDAEAIFRLIVQADPDRFAGSRCEASDIDCVVEAATAVCAGLTRGDIGILARLSVYSNTFEDDRGLVEGAINTFCPEHRPLLAFPPVALPEGRYLAVDGSVTPPSTIPPGTYTALLDRGSECFWQQRTADDVLAEELVDVTERAITVSITLQPGETLTTFGCGTWLLEP